MTWYKISMTNIIMFWHELPIFCLMATVIKHIALMNYVQKTLGPKWLFAAVSITLFEDCTVK